eukprot:gnl/Dysnectes_brevis/4850_a6720_705.p1 GENE.gnl/Dysnectes_brevis/4850_a6720_705~~gnl/Dysnectes_brevis/4850_a6720_705.p1  ORF type:complete len:202 (-),score=8.66 gnl/Dysnectes_brevis/4850_a6720_705:32-637(-)
MSHELAQATVKLAVIEHLKIVQRPLPYSVILKQVSCPYTSKNILSNALSTIKAEPSIHFVDIDGHVILWHDMSFDVSSDDHLDVQRSMIESCRSQIASLTNELADISQQLHQPIHSQPPTHQLIDAVQQLTVEVQQQRDLLSRLQASLIPASEFQRVDALTKKVQKIAKKRKKHCDATIDQMMTYTTSTAEQLYAELGLKK